MNEVYITRTGAYLPFEPVGNDEMETVLGQVGDAPSRARRIILRSNGIKSRHYALDRQTGRPAMSNAQLTARAIEALGPVEGVEVLACGTTLPDQIAPGHAVMVHGELGWPRLEAVSTAGICVSGGAALKHAWLSVRAGTARKAVATGSELSSALMAAHQFQAEVAHKVQALEAHPEIAFEKDFLRWMLSDGAGAVLMESALPPASGEDDVSLRVEWIDLQSAANDMPVCMYAGAEVDEDGHFRSWLQLSHQECLQRSVFTLKQDVRLLNDNVVRITLGEHLQRLQSHFGLQADSIDWFLPHFSSHFFVPHLHEWMGKAGFVIPQERWFTNLAEKGNTGAASPYIMLDGLFRSGRLRPGQRLLLWIPESGRFSSAFALMTVVRNGG
jgi:3-oxoacyl-[acyl-carrier-protein] synthase-3